MDTRYVVDVQPLPKPTTYRSRQSIDAYLAEHPRCEWCGRMGVEPHHLKSKGAGGGDEHDNLIAHG